MKNNILTKKDLSFLYTGRNCEFQIKTKTPEKIYTDGHIMIVGTEVVDQIIEAAGLKETHPDTIIHGNMPKPISMESINQIISLGKNNTFPLTDTHLVYHNPESNVPVHILKTKKGNLVCIAEKYYEIVNKLAFNRDLRMQYNPAYDEDEVVNGNMLKFEIYTVSNQPELCCTIYLMNYRNMDFIDNIKNINAIPETKAEPGKFEMGPYYTEYFFELANESGQDESFSFYDGSCYDFFILSHQDKVKIPLLENCYGACLITKSNGMCFMQTFNLESEYNDAVKEVEEELKEEDNVNQDNG